MTTSFSLPDIHGNPVSLADYPDAQGFAIVFTCNHCPYAIAYEFRMIELHNEYASKGVPVIAINSNDAARYPQDAFDQMKVRAEQRGFTFPYLHDESQAVAHNYGALKTPHVFLMWREDDGLEKVYEGAIDDNYQSAAGVTKTYLKDAIQAKLEGRTPEFTAMPAIGCSVKWK